MLEVCVQATNLVRGVIREARSAGSRTGFVLDLGVHQVSFRSCHEASCNQDATFAS